MPPLVLTIVLAGTLFLGIGAGYFVRYLHAQSKTNSLELRIKERDNRSSRKLFSQLTY